MKMRNRLAFDGETDGQPTTDKHDNVIHTPIYFAATNEASAVKSQLCGMCNGARISRTWRVKLTCVILPWLMNTEPKKVESMRETLVTFEGRATPCGRIGTTF
jgi:hypothetical protein